MWKKALPTLEASPIHQESDYTFLAKGVKIQGTANLEGVVRIDGDYQGAIHTNDTLIIGEHAVIRGSITANEIICSGKLEATLVAKTKIQLLSPAVLIGKISTPALIMEPGAMFQGSCDMGLNPVGGKVTERLPETERVLEVLPQPAVV